MKLLAWDTSTKSGALVALEWPEKASWEGVRLVAEMSFNVDASTHSDGLLWGIHHCLAAARWKLEDVDVFGVGHGPGSFTGLRIGITTARTLAHTLKKPLIGVSSLLALARPVACLFAGPLGESDPIVIATTDACKGELFALWGKASDILASKPAQGAQASPHLQFFEEVITPSDLMPRILKSLGNQKGSRWLTVGEGSLRYLEDWNQLPIAKRLTSPGLFSSFVQGRYLGQLVWEAFELGGVHSPLDVQPRYLRASDAEVRLKKGLLGTF